MLTNYTVGEFMSDKIENFVIFKNLWDGGMICASLRWANITNIIVLSVPSKVTFYFIDKVRFNSF